MPKMPEKNMEKLKFCERCGTKLTDEIKYGVDKPESSGFALPSLVSGILAVAFFIDYTMPDLILALSLVGIGTGILSLIRISRGNGRVTGRGISIAGICISIIILILFMFVHLIKLKNF